jgi:hypothetical protein
MTRTRADGQINVHFFQKPSFRFFLFFFVFVFVCRQTHGRIVACGESIFMVFCLIILSCD